jgi:hypothetical protein
MWSERLAALVAKKWFIGAVGAAVGSAATLAGSSLAGSSFQDSSQGYASTGDERASVQRAAENAIDAVGSGDWQQFRDLSCGKAHEDMNHISPDQAKRESELSLTTQGKESITDFTTTVIDGSHALVVASATFAPTKTQPSL